MLTSTKSEHSDSGKSGKTADRPEEEHPDCWDVASRASAVGVMVGALGSSSSVDLDNKVSLLRPQFPPLWKGVTRASASRGLWENELVSGLHFLSMQHAWAIKSCLLAPYLGSVSLDFSHR